MVPEVDREFYSALDAVDRHADLEYDENVHYAPGWKFEQQADLESLVDSLHQRYPVYVDVQHHERDNSLHLSRLWVSPRDRKQGYGSAVMKELTDFADRNNMLMTLQTAGRGGLSRGQGDPGTTSRDRLYKFYGRHGFNRNSSKRNYRPDLHGDMHREPKPRVDRHSEYAATAIHSNRTGQIFTGPMHVLAHNAAAEAGHEDAHNPYMWTDGFITHDGTFVDREEANARTGRKESVDLMASGHLPLASKEDASRVTMSGPKEAQFRALHLKSELGGEERHFFDALDLIDRHNLFRSAAIRHRDTGKIFEGTWHEAARQAASEAGPGYGPWQGHDPWNDEDEYEDGFMTHEGKFLDRGEAEVASSNPETRTHGDRESIGLMIKGHLPMDESLADNADVWKPLRTRLKEHIARKSGNV